MPTQHIAELPADIREILEDLFPPITLKSNLPASQRFVKGDDVVTVQHLGIVEDDGEDCHAFKVCHGVVVKIERRTARVSFVGDIKPRRIRVSELLDPPPPFDDGSKRTLVYVPVAAWDDDGKYIDPVVAKSPAAKKRNRKSGSKSRQDKAKKARWSAEEREQREAEQAATPVAPVELHGDPMLVDVRPPPVVTNPEPVAAVVETVSAPPAIPDEAMASLAAWIEMGEDMLPTLVKRREEVLTHIAAFQNELRTIDVALKMFGREQAAALSTRGKRDPEKAKRVRNLIRRVCSGASEGLSSAEVAASVDGLDSGVDRYDVHNALSQMHRRGMIGRTGTRGAYVYSVPSGAALE